MALFDTIRAGAAGAGGGYEIERSLRFNDGDTAYLERTASGGNRRTWTYSVWIKLGQLGTVRHLFSRGTVLASPWFMSYMGVDDKFKVWFLNQSIGVSQLSATQAVYRDPNAWMHFVVRCDTTQSTAADRLRVYVNGEQQIFETYAAPPQNYETEMNTAAVHSIGRQQQPNQYWDGYMAEFNHVDGQSLAPTSFAETNSTTGQWVPKKYTGSYGTDGFYLNFSDNSGTSSTTLGKDSSGNGNNWSPNNFSVSSGRGNDSLEDTPTNNFATLDARIGFRQSGGSVTFSNGNLDFVTSSSNTSYQRYPQAFSSLGARSGKWYCEFQVINMGSAGIGVANTGDFGGYTGSNPYAGFAPTAMIISNTGERRGDDSAEGGHSHYTTNDIIGVAMDLDNSKVYMHKNGTYYFSGNPSTGSNGISIPAPSTQSINGGYYVFTYGADNFSAANGAANFGQRPFSYTIPTGFQTLCTNNLPEPSIFNYNKDYFATHFYTGTGSNRSFSNLQFSPDLVWVKKRNGGSARSWQVFDVLRGAQQTLHTDSSGTSHSNSNRLSSFDSNGFSIGTSGGDDGINANGAEYVFWAWEAGTSTVTNNSGSLSSQVRANPSAGFSVVSYTGGGGTQTVGHGLGAKPSWIIIKNLGESEIWIVWIGSNRAVGHDGQTGGGQKYFSLDNSTRLNNNTDSLWNNTDATSTVWSMGGENVVNGNGKNYIAYVWANVAGFSDTGVYVGSGSDNGPCIRTDFKPYWIIIKCASQGEHWQVPIFFERDNGDRSTMRMLHPNLNNAEANLADSPSVQILSNGFKITTNDTNVNGSNLQYWYYASAENPTKYTRGC